MMGEIKKNEIHDLSKYEFGPTQIINTYGK